MIIKIRSCASATMTVVLRASGNPSLLARALNSVLRQEYKFFEAYLVFDSEPSTRCREVLTHHRHMMTGAPVGASQQPSIMRPDADELSRLVGKASVQYVCQVSDLATWHPKFLKEAVAALVDNPSWVATVSPYSLTLERDFRNQVYSVKTEAGPALPDVVGIHDVAAGLDLPWSTMVLRHHHATGAIGWLNFFHIEDRWFNQLQLARRGDIGVMDNGRVEVHVLDGDNTFTSSIDSKKRMLIRSWVQDNADSGLLILLQQNQERVLSEFGHQHLREDDQVKVNQDLIQRLERIEQKLTNQDRHWWSFFSRRQQ